MLYIQRTMAAPKAVFKFFICLFYALQTFLQLQTATCIYIIESAGYLIKSLSQILWYMYKVVTFFLSFN